MVQKNGLSPLVSTCIAINLMVGSGILALPRAFADSGIILGSVVLFIIAIIMYITCTYEGIAMFRASYLNYHLFSKEALDRIEVTDIFSILGKLSFKLP